MLSRRERAATDTIMLLLDKIGEDVVLTKADYLTVEGSFESIYDPAKEEVLIRRIKPITRGELREVIFSAHGMGEVAVVAPLNPDCRDEKHQACAGDGWDLEKDEPTTCHCDCHN